MPSPQGPLKTFLRELHRRNVWRAAAILVGAGWGVLQVIDLFIERGFVPEWVFAGALVALALGVPMVLATAWAQGGRSEWEGRDDEEDDATPDLLEQLTWKRTIVGGVLAFALLGVVTTVYMGMRLLGVGPVATLAAQGVFEEGGRIVLADFESTAGDAAPGDLITEALRIDLAQSTALQLVPQGRVAELRQLMLMEPDEPLHEEAAREVALRDGVGAVVSGEVGRLGSGFVITSRVVEAESGDALASFRVTADADSELIEAVDELAARMRGKIGESLRSVAASPPLPSYTTTSLEALKKVAYVRNRLERGAVSYPIAQQIVSEAIALDSTFASAHQLLAILIANAGGDRELGARAFEAAYRHRERLSERERLAVEAQYLSYVVGDQDASNRVFRRMTQLDSLTPNAWINLADNLMYAGRYEEAVRASRAVTAWESGAWVFNLAVSLAGLQRSEDAMVVMDSAEVTRPTDPYLGIVRGLLLTNFDLAERGRAAVHAWPRPEGAPLGMFHYALAQADFVQGRLADGRAHIEEVNAANAEFSSPGDVLQWGLASPWISALYERDGERTRADLESLLDRVGWDDLSPYNRNYPLVALTHALIGDTARVSELSERFAAEVPEFGNPYAVSRMKLARGLAAVYSQGVDGVRELEEGAAAIRCVRCADLFLAHGYEVAGRVDEAIDAYERYTASRFFTFPEIETHLFVPVAYERLGLLYAAKGDSVQAREMLERVVGLWTDADPPLRSRAQDELGRVGGR